MNGMKSINSLGGDNNNIGSKKRPLALKPV